MACSRSDIELPLRRSRRDNSREGRCYQGTRASSVRFMGPRRSVAAGVRTISGAVEAMLVPQPARTPRQPLVSVGLPVHNGERYLAVAIESVLAQDLADFELIVSDNGSTDTTPEICRRYARQDRRVRFVRSGENHGAAWNFNRVVGLATAPYFKWVAHDDAHAPTFLSRCVAELEANPRAVLCHARTLAIDSLGRPSGAYDEDFAVEDPLPHRRWRRLLRFDTGCYEVFGVIRTDRLRQTGLIGPFSDSDRVLLAELALHGTFLEVSEPLFLHREHPDRSIYRQSDQRSRDLWFDPTRSSLALPTWRLAAELLRATHRAPLSAQERLRCRLEMLGWVRRHWLRLLRNPAGAVKRAALDRYSAMSRAA